MNMNYEYYTTVTPLGIRFWDSAQDRQVNDNLAVKAYPVKGTGPVVCAFRSASGVYGFQGLPGMRAVEFGEDNGDKKSFFIEVTDTLNRFLPAVFTIELPLDYDGVYLSDDTPLPGSSPGTPNPPGFYLFSAPARGVSPGMAAIHATLIEQATKEPAAFAVMEVAVESSGGENMGKWYGIADERGCLSILFPYPAMEVSLSQSPPVGPSLSLDRQEWQLTIQVRYEPAKLSYPSNINIENGIPLLESILNQSAGVIWTQGPVSPVTGSYVDQWSTVLTFGKALILKTAGVEKSELWIDKK